MLSSHGESQFKQLETLQDLIDEALNAKPFGDRDKIQSAIESVICSGNSYALGALLLTDGSLAGPRQPMSAPSTKSRQTVSTSAWFLNPRLKAKLRSLEGSMDDLPTKHRLHGNLLQNSGPGSSL